MLPQNKPDRIRILFDDRRLAADAGLLLPATLARHLGLRELVDRHLDLGGAPGRANAGDKMLTPVASALAGGDCIDDADALRAGGTVGVLGCVVKASSTLGTFLRSFRWGHVRQLDRVSRQLLARAWAAGAGPGDSPPTIDLDSTICETYGPAKEGARHHGYTGARGYHPLPAIAAGTGEVLMSRLRYGGAKGQLTVRADSGFYAHTVVAACREMDVRFSITIRQRASLRDLIEAIPEEDWTPIPYWTDGAADVAETTYTPFQTKPDAAPVRLIVRRVKPTPGSQLALFARYSYHAFITDRDGETLELEADHRRHAEVENAIRDLKYGADWSGRADRDHQDPQAAGLRSGGTDHPLGAPPHFASPPALALGNPVQSRLGPAASHSIPGLTASLQLTQRPRKLAPAQSASASSRVLSRHLALPNVRRRSQGLPAATEDRHRPPLPKIVPGPSPPLAPHRPFPCCNLIPSVDSGLSWAGFTTGTAFINTWPARRTVGHARSKWIASLQDKSANTSASPCITRCT